jgi:hypothetical protein
MALLYFFPIAEFMVQTTNYYLDFIEIASVVDAKKQVVSQVYPITILLSLVVFLSFFAIFLFKNRNLQTRIITFSMLLKFGFLALIVFYIYKFGNTFESKLYLQTSFIIPIIAGILDFMAFKAILKDINIIKSYDRIR